MVVMLVARARAPMTRVIVLIMLIAVATVALRGHIPGAPAAGPAEPGPPSALTVALMPVLLTVSIVVLLAGVLASQHRLPLSMPEPEREPEPVQWRLGRTGLLVLAALTAFALLVAAASAVFFVVLPAQAPTEPAPATGSGAPPEPAPTGAPSPGSGAAELSGTALTLAVVAAVALVAVSCAGLLAVALATRRRARETVLVEAPAPPAEVGSLARAAEMGLAAMNAPGQDPRTAIIACYVAMERGLASGRAAAPLASDTPMEVLARAFERGALHDTSARELVALFEEARFSPHAMLEWQRMRAEQLLRVVLADLQGEMPQEETV
ncbi:DUF4129 domain-containing protein [Nocardia farcinica]|nr:DUF4129 domain-containing protein [Nocardia farcinica]MBC9817267.1 DUF4129 domain-containing protein [Nocardia farcinica]MBF6421800.1 DUF4129 domain-containing protein [Nocardia farcinica]MBF6433457.1 DUF4129 domain-containing protein [Nocardia farcinica]MBF6443784.1 DUF4129 domain-containing protein [Nocardia farcinica]